MTSIPHFNRQQIMPKVAFKNQEEHTKTVIDGANV